jgi:LacI family sucrose operon transcriptional repressor
LTAVFPGIYDGVIASNDVQALEISNIYRQAGLRLNQDYFLTGYNGSRLIRQTNPELPTVIQPIEELSAKLIDTLMMRIKNPQTAVSSVVVPVHFYAPKK